MNKTLSRIDVTHHAVSNSGKIRRLALFGAAILASLSAAGPAFADVPPASSIQGGSGGGNGAVVDKLLSDAQKAVKSGNIQLALIHLRNAVSAAPRNGTARAQLGIVLIAAGEEPAAERELRQARKDGAPELLVLPPLFEVMLARDEFQLLLDQFADPGTGAGKPAAADILKARALALQNLGKTSEATDAMDRSLALRRDGSGLLTRARLSYLQKDIPAAKKYIDEAIAKSEDPGARLFKIAMLIAATDYTAALDEADQLLAKFPGNLRGRFARIEVYLDLKQDAKAKAEVDDILAKYPNAFLAIYYRAQLLARGGDVKGAWNIAQNLPEEFRDTQPGISIVLAQMAEDAGSIDTAASILGRVLVTHPDEMAPRVRLGAIRLKQGKPADALNVLTPLKDSSDPRAIELLCNTYIALHRDKEALDALKKLDTLGKGRADVKRSIAMLEIQMGQTDQGIKNLLQLASADPTNFSIVDPLIEALTRSQRLPEALAVADRLGADPAKRAAALTYRGGILALQHDNAGAMLAFDKAVASDPKSIGALNARAQFLVSTRKFPEAGRDLRTILSLDAKNIPALMKLAEIAEQQGEDQNVRKFLGQAIAAAPADMTPRFALLRYLTGHHNYAEALTAANDLLRIEPNNTDGLVFRGQAQSGLGQKKEAVTTYRRLVSLMPTAAAPQVLLGNALFVAGDRMGASGAMETAVKLGPNAADVRAAQISLQIARKDFDAAVASARAFQATNPGSAADVLLADTLDRVNRRDQATAVLNKSYSERPSAEVLLRLVRIAAQAGDRSRAGDMMSSWLAANPGDTGIRLEYANFLMGQESNSQAIAQYQIVLKREPNNVLAMNNLGWLLQDSDPERAISMLTLARQLAPNSADIADTLGWVKLQQKDVAGGLDLLSKAHAMRPRDGQITYHLVIALDANGRRDAARGLLKALLARGDKFKDLPAATKLSSSWH